MALQHTHTLTGAQVPQSDATVQRGGEELQPADVWVELDQAAQQLQFQASPQSEALLVLTDIDF